VTNITLIVASENLIFLWMGMRPGRRQDTQRGVVAWWVLIVGLLVIVTASIIRLSQDATEEIAVEDVLIGQLPAAEFVSIDERFRDDGTLSVLFTVRSPEDITPQRVSELEDILENDLGNDVALDIVNIRVVEARNQFENDVLAVLQNQFPTGNIAELNIAQQDDASFRVNAVLRIAETVTIDDVAAAEQALNDQFEQSFRLFIVVETVLSVPQPEVMPELTPEVTPETDD